MQKTGNFLQCDVCKFALLQDEITGTLPQGWISFSLRGFVRFALGARGASVDLCAGCATSRSLSELVTIIFREGIHDITEVRAVDFFYLDTFGISELEKIETPETRRLLQLLDERRSEGDKKIVAEINDFLVAHELDVSRPGMVVGSVDASKVSYLLQHVLASLLGVTLWEPATFE